MIFDNFMPVKIISGEGCVKKYNYSAWGRRCIIITGKKAVKESGLLSHLEKVLSDQCIEYFIFDGVFENPSVELCYEAGGYANEFGAAFIIGAGGGSAMDTAKAASVFASNPTLEAMGLFTANQIKTPLPVILIGTTAGTGSEVTPVSVLTVDMDGNRIKKSFRSPLIYAKASLCDPEYTISMTWEQTANTALDSICHAVESLFSVKAGCFEELYACEAIRVGWEALIKAHWRVVIEKRDVEYSQRERLLYASIMGGLAINGTGTCFPHTLGYALTTIKNIPHGKACAAFLGEFVRIMQGADERKASLLLDAVKEEKIETFLTGIESMAGEMPVLSDEEAKQFTKYIENAPALSNSIKAISNEEAYRLYKKLFVR